MRGAMNRPLRWNCKGQLNHLIYNDTVIVEAPQISYVGVYHFVGLAAQLLAAVMPRVIVAAFAPIMVVSLEDRQRDSRAELAKQYCEGRPAGYAEGSASLVSGQE